MNYDIYVLGKRARYAFYLFIFSFRAAEKGAARWRCVYSIVVVVFFLVVFVLACTTDRRDMCELTRKTKKNKNDHADTPHALSHWDMCTYLIQTAGAVPAEAQGAQGAGGLRARARRLQQRPQR